MPALQIGCKGFFYGDLTRSGEEPTACLL